MVSSSPTTWRSWCCAGRDLADADLDAPVPWLGHLVGGRNLGLAEAAARHRDPYLGDAELEQLVATALGASQRERVVVLRVPHAIGVADDDDLGRRPPRDLGKDLVDECLGLRRELVGVAEEVQV